MGNSEITIRPPRVDAVRGLDDSRRWAGYRFRHDDIFIVTPPKCGTTWTQGIVASLLWPAGDAPGPGFELSPWPEFRIRPIEAVLAETDQISWRRFIKSHTQLDAIPFATPCRYVGVFRDGRDAIASWANHRRKMRPEVVDTVNASAAEDGLPPMARMWDGDMDDLLVEWEAERNVIPILRSFWEVKDLPNVLLVHYADLLADLDGEMRRIAEFLGIDVPEELWDQTVDRCRFEDMKRQHDASGMMHLGFDGGAQSFFDQGGVGRWEGVLEPRHLDRWAELAAAGLTAEQAAWLEHGSLVLGHRP